MVLYIRTPEGNLCTCKGSYFIQVLGKSVIVKWETASLLLGNFVSEEHAINARDRLLENIKDAEQTERKFLWTRL